MAKYETFRCGRMMSEDVQSLLYSIKYQEKDEYAPVHDGALVVVGNCAPNDAYNLTRNGTTLEGAVDDNVYLAKAPAAVRDDVLIVDLAEISGGDIADNYYTMGIRLYGLVARAGIPVRARVPMKHDKFWLSGGCFVSAPTVGEYATATADDTHHTPVNTAATEGYCVKIENSRDFVVGNQLAYKGETDGYVGKLYLCRVL